MAKTLGPVKRKFSPWTDPDAVPFIRFENVTKRFGDFIAVDNLSLDIYEREFFSLLGPSGCGKTTLLRMIAGFEAPTSGRILLEGQDIIRRAALQAAGQHDVPVLCAVSAYDGARRTSPSACDARALPTAEIARARATRRWSWCKLAAFGKRKPHQLSGGQRQRVALARALVKRPKAAAARRTARRAGPQAARGDAVRADGHPAPSSA